jgi:hypothetical protein
MDKSKSETNEKVCESGENIKKYIDSLTPFEKIAYEIAKTRLKTSFDIEKSIGFKSFRLT